MKKSEINQKLDSAEHELLKLKEKASQIDPENWYLQLSELTTLGYKNICREIVSNLKPADTKILDWGGGSGFLSFFLEKMNLNLNITYYDFKNDSALYSLILDNLNGEKIFAEDSVRLPFDDSSYDVVVSCGVLEHASDIPGSIKEIKGILKPGGLFFIYHFPNKFSYTEYLANKIGQDSHAVKLTKNKFLNLFRSNDFDILNFHYRYLFPRNLTDFPALRRFMTRNSKSVFKIDKSLVKIPGLRIFSTSLNAIIKKPA